MWEVGGTTQSFVQAVIISPGMLVSIYKSDHYRFSYKQLRFKMLDDWVTKAVSMFISGSHTRL